MVELHGGADWGGFHIGVGEVKIALDDLAADDDDGAGERQQSSMKSLHADFTGGQADETILAGVIGKGFERGAFDGNAGLFEEVAVAGVEYAPFERADVSLSAGRADEQGESEDRE